ncbi:unnamed protein product, partial [Laminaria digitata]
EGFCFSVHKAGFSVHKQTCLFRKQRKGRQRLSFYLYHPPPVPWVYLRSGCVQVYVCPWRFCTWRGWRELNEYENASLAFTEKQMYTVYGERERRGNGEAGPCLLQG